MDEIPMTCRLGVPATWAMTDDRWTGRGRTVVESGSRSAADNGENNPTLTMHL